MQPDISRIANAAPIALHENAKPIERIAMRLGPGRTASLAIYLNGDERELGATRSVDADEAVGQCVSHTYADCGENRRERIAD